MKFSLLRPRQLARTIREMALRRPDTAEEYLDSHPDYWDSIATADPHDAADILEALSDEAAADLIRELDQDQAVEILEEMREGAAAELINEFTVAKAAELIGEMDTDKAADILGELSPMERDALLEAIEDDTAEEVGRLLAFPADTAGGLMTTDVAALPAGLSTDEAIEALRRLHETLDDLSYVYVVDELDRLKGVVSFRELVFARPGTGLDAVMVANPVSVSPLSDREEVAELIQRYNLFALPVVGDDGKLLGMVGVEEAMEVIQEEATEDIAVMVGAGVKESVYTPVGRSVRMRLPWIAVNLALAALVASVIRSFEGAILDEFVVLAALMPVVAHLGGNGGAQSLAVVIRAMAVDQVPGGRVRRVILRELAVGALNGAAMAILAGLIALLLSGEARLAGVMAAAAFGNMTIAGFAGAGIPILLRHLGQDPALASNIFLTFITDMVGFGGFLVIATMLLG